MRKVVYHQASWDEPLILERSHNGKRGHNPPLPTSEEMKVAGREPWTALPKSLLRSASPMLPEVSEPEVVRHFTRLSQENYTPDLGIYPLGSCTMKYNPKIADLVVQNHRIEKLHPEQDESTIQGILRLLYQLDRILSEITGMSRMTLQPAAGAHGEFLGALIMRAHHQSNGELDRRSEMVVPDSAHGTNPASAAMSGFKVVVVPSNRSGMVNLDALRSVAGPRTAGLMITNPNTLGIFERDILDVAEAVHTAGGLVYYDGANFNPILGKVRPGDMGFDIVHLNLHKTFATPHGGGGPGAGPVGVTKNLEKFLPVPLVEFDGNKYYLDYDVPNTIGKVRGFHGNVGVLVRAYAYILSLGIKGLETAAETAVLNTNYVLTKVMKSGLFDLPFNTSRKHEFVLSGKRLADRTGVRVIDIAKRMLDSGVHSPTVYFPLVVDEAVMVEPTETENMHDLDLLVKAMVDSARDAETDPDIVKGAPENTSVRRIDEVKASHPRTLKLKWSRA